MNHTWHYAVRPPCTGYCTTENFLASGHFNDNMNCRDLFSGFIIIVYKVRKRLDYNIRSDMIYDGVPKDWYVILCGAAAANRSLHCREMFLATGHIYDNRYVAVYHVGIWSMYTLSNKRLMWNELASTQTQWTRMGLYAVRGAGLTWSQDTVRNAGKWGEGRWDECHGENVSKYKMYNLPKRFRLFHERNNICKCPSNFLTAMIA